MQISNVEGIFPLTFTVDFSHAVWSHQILKIVNLLLQRKCWDLETCVALGVRSGHAIFELFPLRMMEEFRFRLLARRKRKTRDPSLVRFHLYFNKNNNNFPLNKIPAKGSKIHLWKLAVLSSSPTSLSTNFLFCNNISFMFQRISFVNCNGLGTAPKSLQLDWKTKLKIFVIDKSSNGKSICFIVFSSNSSALKLLRALVWNTSLWYNLVF